MKANIVHVLTVLYIITAVHISFMADLNVKIKINLNFCSNECYLTIRKFPFILLQEFD